ncbi:MAG: alpha-amylase [Bacilli bacterium]|nr:alpha-amylase [Bacilli bacterium]
MIKKIFMFITVVTLFLALSACANTQSVFEKAFPENDTYYEVFVRSFADSDEDGIGDFNGLTDKLDYFVDLGIDALWLMPIHPSPSYHGYDVTDYYDVNPDYGTMEDFTNLISQADDKGIKIILDMVFNHTSELHLWFQAALAGDATYRDYYVFASDTSNLNDRWNSVIGGTYYAYFGGWMPDLNMLNDDVFNEIVNISKFWLDKGVAGFRLDAAGHLFGDGEYIGITTSYIDNIIYLRNYTEQLDEYKNDVYVTAEIYESTLYQVVGDYFGAVDSPLDFPVAATLRSAAQNNSNRRYATVLEDIYDYYRKINKNFISAPFIVNHDMDRFATQVLGNEEMLKLSAEMLLVLPGNPIIYYGEELGMYGYKANGSNGIWDETRRMPFLWNDEYLTTWVAASIQDVINVNTQNESLESVSEQMENPDSLWSTYEKMLRLRNENIALKYGNSFVRWEESTNELQGFYREVSYEKYGQKLLILHNFGEEALDMISYNGTIIYISGVDNPAEATQIPGRSTVIIEIVEEA